jgi:hypothetical protein
MYNLARRYTLQEDFYVLRNEPLVRYMKVNRWRMHGTGCVTRGEALKKRVLYR